MKSFASQKCLHVLRLKNLHFYRTLGLNKAYIKYFATDLVKLLRENVIISHSQCDKLQNY